MKFEGIYKVCKNEYEITNRPLYFEIESEEITPDMSDDDLFGLFMDCMYDNFDAHIQPSAENVELFIEWAKSNKLIENETVE